MENIKVNFYRNRRRAKGLGEILFIRWDERALWFDCGTRMKVSFALWVMADFFDGEHTVPCFD